MGLPGDVFVIVGGGLAGLAAAVHLGRAGVRCVLFHDSTELGGRARTECRAGFHFNFGRHRSYDRGAAVTGLRALEVAVDGAPRGPNGGLAICDGVKHTPLPRLERRAGPPRTSSVCPAADHRHVPDASPIVGDESASHKLLHQPPDLREIEEFA